MNETTPAETGLIYTLATVGQRGHINMPMMLTVPTCCQRQVTLTLGGQSIHGGTGVRLMTSTTVPVGQRGQIGIPMI